MDGSSVVLAVTREFQTHRGQDENRRRLGPSLIPIDEAGEVYWSTDSLVRPKIM